jgi:predicted Rossmann fold flavoprotein
MAHRLGHHIVEIRPSLVALVSDMAAMKELEGVRLKNIRAQLVVEGKAVADEFGEIEFSRRGLEGPVILRMSRTAVDAVIDEKKVEVVLDLKPALTEEILRARIAREVEQLPQQAFAIELLRKMLPRNLVYFVASAAGVHPKAFANRRTADEVGRIIGAMKRVVFPITDYVPFEESIVTAGGVDTTEVDAETLQSKLVKGLYFAGEVLDLDADTGGYNLQIAFSTGRLASQLRK